MTDSRREQIVKRIATVLTALNIPGATIVRTRTTPLARAEGPSIQIAWKDDVPNVPSVSPAPIQWSLNIEIKIIVRGDIPDQVADPFIVAVHNGLLADVSLNNLAQDVRPGQVTFESFDADDSAGIASLPFIVDYRNSSYSDLTS